jgi:hypothetical protein
VFSTHWDDDVTMPGDDVTMPGDDVTMSSLLVTQVIQERVPLVLSPGNLATTRGVLWKIPEFREFWECVTVELLMLNYRVFTDQIHMLRCYFEALSQCYSVTVLVSQCNSVTVLKCYSVTLLQCHSVTVLQCGSVMSWN